MVARFLSACYKFRDNNWPGEALGEALGPERGEALGSALGPELGPSLGRHVGLGWHWDNKSRPRTGSLTGAPPGNPEEGLLLEAFARTSTG
jgi:hypothetical protein